MTRMYFVRIKECSSGTGTNDYDRTYRLSLSHVTIVCKKKTNITRSTPNLSLISKAAIEGLGLVVSPNDLACHWSI